VRGNDKKHQKRKISKFCATTAVRTCTFSCTYIVRNQKWLKKQLDAILLQKLCWTELSWLQVCDEKIMIRAGAFRLLFAVTRIGHSRQQAFATAAAVGGRDITPAVRGLLEEAKLSPSDVKATGPKGHILKGDVLQAIAGSRVVF
jgi:hypothetical protein